MTLLMRYDEERAEGRAEGMKEGREEERRKIILNMINQGFDDEQIMMLCDVSEQELNEYRMTGEI